MKKTVCALVTSAVIVLGSALPGVAMTGPGEPRGTGVRPGFGAHQTFRGPHEHEGRPGFQRHPEFRGHRGVHSHIVIVNPGFWWDPAFPDYPDSAVTPEPAPPVYAQPGTPPDQAGYWYYCQNPPGYYPYVTECPAGWVAVLPPAQ